MTDEEGSWLGGGDPGEDGVATRRAGNRLATALQRTHFHFSCGFWDPHDEQSVLTAEPSETKGD